MWAATTSAASQPPYADDVGRDRALHAQPDRGVGADADHERDHEQEELGAPATPVHEPHQCAGLAHSAMSWRAA